MPYMKVEKISGKFTCVWERTFWQKLRGILICRFKGHVPSMPVEMNEFPTPDQSRLKADSVTYCCRCLKALHAQEIDKGPYVYEPFILPAVR